MSTNIPSQEITILTIRLETKRGLASVKDSWLRPSEIHDSSLCNFLTQMYVCMIHQILPNWLMDVGSWQRRFPNVIYTNKALYILYIVRLSLLIVTPYWYTRRIKEAIHIRLHPNNINRDSGINNHIFHFTLYSYHNFIRCAIIFFFFFWRNPSNFRYITGQLFLLHLTLPYIIQKKTKPKKLSSEVGVYVCFDRR